jgi:O-antigen/teichoic acid export membrane protein
MGRSTLLTTARLGLALASGLLTSIMLARSLGASGRGELALLLQTPALVATALGFGIGSASTYFVGRDMRTPGEAFADSTVVIIPASLLGAPVAVVMSSTMPGLDGVTTGLMALAAITIPLTLGLLLTTGIATGIKRIEALALRQSVASLGGLALIALLFFSGRLNVASALSATILANVGTLAATVSVCGRQIRRTIARPSLHRLTATAGYSARAHLSAVAGLLGRRQDVLLLGYLGTASQVGIYAVGTLLAELLWQLSSAISSPLMARSLQADETDGALIAAQAGRITFAVTLAAMVCLAATAFPLIGMLYSPAFMPAGWVFMLLAPGVLIYGIGSVLAQYMLAQGRLFLGTSIVIAVSNLLLNLLAIPLWGVYGAALASTVSYGVGGITLTWLFLKHTGLALRHVLILDRHDISAVRASLASAITHRAGRESR